MSEPDPAVSSGRRGRRLAWWAWHQRLGLGFALVFIAVIVTGIALNHTEGLALDERRLTANWVYDWYDMNPVGQPVAYALDRDVAAWWDGTVYFNDQRVDTGGGLVGALALPEVSLIASATDLWVLTPGGDLVEKLGAASLPAGEIEAVGRGPGEAPVLLRTSQGIFASSVDLLAWAPTDQTGIFLGPIELTTAQRNALLTAHRGEGISLYRVMLDLHSGRFFGRMGVWVVDLAAIALGFLTLSGAWYALRVKRR